MFLKKMYKKQHYLSILKTASVYTKFHSEKEPNRIDQTDPHMTETVRDGLSYFGLNSIHP